MTGQRVDTDLANREYWRRLDETRAIQRAQRREDTERLKEHLQVKQASKAEYRGPPRRKR